MSVKNKYSNACIFICCVFLVTNSPAQVSYYCFSQSAGTYSTITGGTVHTSTASDDAIYSSVSLGFTFNFNGTDYTSCAISTNGFITFGGTNPAGNLYSPISSTTAYNGAISALGNDLVGGTSGELRSETLGSSPNRIFVVQWSTWRRYGCSCGFLCTQPCTSDNLNFQIRLYETSNKIDIVYGSFTTASYTKDFQVGLRGSTNADYNNRSTTTNWTTTTTGTANNSICRTTGTIKPPSGRTFTWNPSPTAPTTTGASRCGTGTVVLSASGASAGYQYKWYDALTGGTLLKTSANNTDNTYTTPSIAATTNYYVTIINTATGCESGPRIICTATILNTPATPGAITGSSTVCANNAGYVYSISPVTYATTYNWGVPAGSTITAGAGTTSITVTYGASSGNVTVNASNMCGTSANQTLAITVNATPSAPGVTNASRSGAGSVVLSASGAGAGEDYKWYDALSGGTLLQTGGSTYTTPSLSVTTTYYVTKYYTGGSGCESGPRTPVTAYIYTGRGMDAYGVTRTTGITYTNISGTGTAVTSWRNGSSSENLSNSINIGFNFAFDGSTHTQFRVSTSGYITFNTSTNATGSYLPACGTYDCYSSNNSLFTSTGKAGTLQAIAPFYNSIGPSSYSLNTSVHYQVTGAAPNRVLTIQWRGLSESVNSSCSPCDYSDRNFQVKLYETSNNIEFLYSTMYTGWDITDNSYTAGLNSSTLSGAPTAAQLLTQQTANTATFNNTVQNGLTTAPATNSKITFTYAAPAVPGALPGCATMNFPSNGATNQCLNTILSWGQGTNNPTGYDVYFGTAVSPPLVSSNQKTTYYNPGTLAINTTYYWKIVPKNHFGDAAACATYSFSTLVGDVAPTSITSSVVGTGTATAPVFCRGTTSTISIVGGNLSSGSAFNWSAPFILDFGCTTNPPYPLLPIDACDDATSFSYTFNSAGTYRWYAFVRGCNGTTSCASIDVTVLEYDNTTPTGITSSAGNPICNGTTTTLTPTGGTMGAGASYQWYTGSCGGTLVGTGNTLDVTPAVTTTYYVRRTGGSTCPNTTSCRTITITVQAAPSSAAGSNLSSCNGTGAITMTGSSAGGSVSTAAWSGGGGLGGWTDPGTPTNPADDYFTPTVTEGSFTATLTVTPVCAGTPATSTRVVTWASYSATYKTWIGTTSTDWFSASNWCDAIPTSTTDALIPASMPNAPTIAAAGAVCRDITINGSATVTISGANTLEVYGNWTKNGSFVPGVSGTIAFRGTTNQSIGGNSSNTFQNLTINNTGTSGNNVITLSQPATVNGALTLTDGYLSTTSTNILTLGSSATATSGSANSFVNGPLIKQGTAAFIFPIGKNGKWARLRMSAPTAASDFRAEYYDNAYSSLTPLSGLSNVSSLEYWQLDRVAGTGNANVRLYWEDAIWSQIADCNTNGDLVVAHWSGGTWTDIGSPSVIAGCTGGTAPPAGWIQSNSVTSFSPFTFGTRGGANPLPVELIFFSAACDNENVYINWTTATETNNDFFTLERSVDGKNFSTVSKIRGGGNSTSLSNYEFIDLLDGIAGDKTFYYRLTQTDFDGRSEHSDIISVKCQEPQFELITIMPNPTRSRFTVFYNSPDNSDIVKLELHDMLGRKVQSMETFPQIGGNTISIDISNSETGVYLLMIKKGNSSFVEKIIKN